MDINELLTRSAILYCGIYNIYDKEKRILNKIRKVIDEVFDPIVLKIKDNDGTLSKTKLNNYCESIDESREEIMNNIARINQINEEVVSKVLADISSVGLVSNDDLDNYESYEENQKKIVLNFLKATENNSIKAFKTTYDDKDQYFRIIIESLKNIHKIATTMIKSKHIDPLVESMLEKMKLDVNELTQDIIDMGKPKENLMLKLKV